MNQLPENRSDSQATGHGQEVNDSTEEGVPIDPAILVDAKGLGNQMNGTLEPSVDLQSAAMDMSFGIRSCHRRPPSAVH